MATQLAKQVLITALFVVFQSCRAQQGTCYESISRHSGFYRLQSYTLYYRCGWSTCSRLSYRSQAVYWTTTQSVCCAGYESCDSGCCPVCSNGDIRLRGGSNSMEGRVEICDNLQWGTVCDDAWGSPDANVACRQLGFSPTGATAHSYAFFGEGTGSILLDQVGCTGTENRLVDCYSNPVGVHDCYHTEDAGVTCQTVCSNGDIRLHGGSNSMEGRVEICDNMQWGTVCDDAWGSPDANVACRQLGFSPTGAIALSYAFFGEGTGSILLDQVGCTGTENRLVDCYSNPLGVHNCYHTEDAGVICQRIVCPNLPNPGNGQVVQVLDGNVPGIVANYSCNPGYTLRGNVDRRECVSTVGLEAMWSGEAPTCQRTVCPNLPNPENGEVVQVLDRNIPGIVATYSCHSGYRLLGNVGRECIRPTVLETVWSGEAPTCQLIVCPNLPNPGNGQVVQVLGRNIPGTVANYSCNPGYRLLGNVGRECIRPTVLEMVWSGEAPTCQLIVCPNLPNPGNGQVVQVLGRNIPGTVANYSCNPGYRLLGNVGRECIRPTVLETVWSGEAPTCQLIVCPNLPNPGNGQVVQVRDGSVPGTVANYSCDAGYRLLGNIARECVHTIGFEAMWTGDAPTCQRIVCPNLPNPRNGHVVQVLDSNVPGTVANYSCDAGYRRLGNISRECVSTIGLEAVWSREAPTCQRIVCPNLPNPGNGRVVQVLYDNVPGTVANYSCDAGYRLLGNMDRECVSMLGLEAMWTREAPTCQWIVCPNLPNYENGQVVQILDGNVPGTVANYSCDAGYLLHGNVSRKCVRVGLDAGWTGEVPVCASSAITSMIVQPTSTSTSITTSTLVQPILTSMATTSTLVQPVSTPVFTTTSTLVQQPTSTSTLVQPILTSMATTSTLVQPVSTPIFTTTSTLVQQPTSTSTLVQPILTSMATTSTLVQPVSTPIFTTTSTLVQQPTSTSTLVQPILTSMATTSTLVQPVSTPIFTTTSTLVQQLTSTNTLVEPTSTSISTTTSTQFQLLSTSTPSAATSFSTTTSTLVQPISSSVSSNTTTLVQPISSSISTNTGMLVQPTATSTLTTTSTLVQPTSGLITTTSTSVQPISTSTFTTTSILLQQISALTSTSASTFSVSTSAAQHHSMVSSTHTAPVATPSPMPAPPLMATTFQITFAGVTNCKTWITDRGPEKMAALTGQLATSLKFICSCNLTQDHITNGRWVCNPRDPTTILFRADVAGTGDVNSSTIANDVSQWAQQTSSVRLGTETLPVQGAMQCDNENCITSSVATAGPSNLWTIVFAGILVLVIVIAVVVGIVLWWRSSRMKSFRIVSDGVVKNPVFEEEDKITDAELPDPEYDVAPEKPEVQ